MTENPAPAHCHTCYHAQQLLVRRGRRRIIEIACMRSVASSERAGCVLHKLPPEPTTAEPDTSPR